MPEQDTDKTGAEGEPKAGETKTEPETKDEPLGDGGKAALDAERAARKAAERDARALRERLDAIDEAERKRKDAEAAQKGEWEKLAADREAERDAAKADASRLTAENDQLRAAIAAVLDGEWKQLPAEVRDAYLGADDDPLARLAFLPKGKALAEKLAEKGATARGNGHDPRASGGAGGSVEDETRALAARGGYSM